jgi:excisionase family DNA binding protein
VERLTLTVDEAAVLLGVSRGTAYEMIQRDEFPVEPIRVGRRILIPKAKLMKMLEGEQNESDL